LVAGETSTIEDGPLSRQMAVVMPSFELRLHIVSADSGRQTD
jgi:hypothetical protein